MHTTRYDHTELGEVLSFSFLKGVPGDIYRYKNCLELPTLYGASIHIFPVRWGVNVYVENMDFNEAIYYVGNHKRDRKNDALKF